MVKAKKIKMKTETGSTAKCKICGISRLKIPSLVSVIY